MNYGSLTIARKDLCKLEHYLCQLIDTKYVRDTFLMIARIHKATDLTIAGRSMVLPGTIPSFHDSIPEAVNGAGTDLWGRSNCRQNAGRWLCE